MGIKIARTDDLELIRELSDAYFPEYALTDKELDASEWWVATLDKEPVALAGIQLDIENNRAFLNRGLVLPQARGGGLQKRLIRVRKNYARASGIDRCYSYVWSGNIPSLRSLLACGFKPYFYQKIGDGEYIYLESKPATPKVYPNECLRDSKRF